MHRSKKNTDDWLTRVVLKIFVMFHCFTVGLWWIISNDGRFFLKHQGECTNHFKWSHTQISLVESQTDQTNLTGIYFFLDDFDHNRFFVSDSILDLFQ